MTHSTSHADQNNDTDAPIGGQQWRTAAQTTLTRLLTDQLDRVNVSTGHRVLDLTGAADIAHVSRLVGPSGHLTAVDAPSGTDLPADPRGFDIVLAHRQPDQLDAIAPMTALLRSEGWLILAGTIVAPPIVYSAVPGGTTVIDLVIRAIHALTPSPAASPSTDATIGLLVALGMDQVCATTHTETIRGGGPGCALYRHAARHLRDQLTGTVGFTKAELDQFERLMQDPGVLLRAGSNVTLHARMTT
ncbi:hypothetical protein ACGFIE_00710 [Micromonospora sp. NPDC049275]|uniref:hypothetical protein n=1 Tax=Micromonospora sp. NPDC049275 TaxID=3364268 RepID=UPI00370FE77C